MIWTEFEKNPDNQFGKLLLSFIREYVGDPLLYKYTQDADGNYETAKVCVLGIAYKSGITAFDKEAEDYEKALNVHKMFLPFRK